MWFQLVTKSNEALKNHSTEPRTSQWFLVVFHANAIFLLTSRLLNCSVSQSVTKIPHGTLIFDTILVNLTATLLLEDASEIWNTHLFKYKYFKYNVVEINVQIFMHLQYCTKIMFAFYSADLYIVFVHQKDCHLNRMNFASENIFVSIKSHIVTF